MKKCVIASIVFMLALSGCALAVRNPTQADLATADYGIEPENPKEQALEYLENTLFDSMSAVVKWESDECSKGWWRWSEDLSNPLFIPKIYYGWQISAKVNAKNRMGAYVGFTNYTFCFRDGKLLHIITQK